MLEKIEKLGWDGEWHLGELMIQAGVCWASWGIVLKAGVEWDMVPFLWAELGPLYLHAYFFEWWNTD